MFRWFIIIGVVLAALAAAAWIWRDPLYFMLLSMRIKPDHAYADSALPAPPDYANETSWAALPGRADNADFTPPGTQDGQAGAAVDVFFVHPTTYINPASWNAPLDDAGANAFTDDFVLRGQASAFNGCCRVHAPRYRQATFYSFFDLDGDGGKALETAYRDVEAAFDHFLEHYNEGRPFILAGHSQGARHVASLLERRISGSPLRDRMVAAYPVGYYLNAEELAGTLPDIPVCADPAQTGCLVTWNTVGPNAPVWQPGTPFVCVNPLSWKTDGAHAAHELNLGALATRADEGKGRIEPGAADAQCTEGRAVVSEIRTDMFDGLPFYMGRDNHHLLDYALFWMNIRENAKARVAAFAGE
jgi:hypothetical protein